VQVPVEVASFLLNEKRTEITKIELKQRINVLLVPNKSLDTPNYKLERLKHDDPRLDNLDSSYKLAEEVDDPTSFTRRSQERTNKQEPVIKGVLPDGPAPVAAPKPEAAPAPVATAPVVAPQPVKVAAPAEKGFFGWLKSLFGGAPAADPAPVPEPVKPAKDGGEARTEGRREGGRDGRGRGGRGERQGAQEGRAPREGREPREGGRNGGRESGRNGEMRGDGRGEGRGEARDANRPQRGEGRNGGRRDNRREAAPAEVPADGEVLLNAAPVAEAVAPESGENQRRERRPRNENRRRNETGDAAAQGLIPAGDPNAEPADQVTAPEGAEGEVQQRAPRERRSRDRYGRDRRERGPREGAPTEEARAEAPVQVAADDEPYEAPTRSYFTRPVEAPSHVAPVPAATPTTHAPTPVASPVATPLAASPAPTSAPAQKGLPKVQPFTVSIDELNRVAQASGLEWVNSDPDKVAQVQAAIAAEPKPVHVPREIKPVVVVDEGPLVLVETRKDLRNMPLPFETQ
jgi:ribonuclease E